MTSTATRLRKAPLVHVLAQVVFPPPPNWAAGVPALQRRLIELGYPRLQEQTTVEVSVEMRDAAGPPVSKQQVHVRYEFADRDQRNAFVLTSSSFVLHTTAYESFAHFLTEFGRGLVALQEVFGLTLVDRIGLRYVDFIQLQPKQSFGLYVHPGLLGYPFRNTPQLGGSKVGFASRSVAVTPLGALAIRSTVLPPSQFVPQDLELGNLRAPEWVDLSKPGLALDFDHFSLFSGPTAQAAMDFNPHAIAEHVTGLHTNVRAAFEAIITAEAISLWGGWEEVTA